jgi:hypothetical protein
MRRTVHSLGAAFGLRCEAACGRATLKTIPNAPAIFTGYHSELDTSLGQIQKLRLAEEMLANSPKNGRSNFSKDHKELPRKCVLYTQAATTAI